MKHKEYASQIKEQKREKILESFKSGRIKKLGSGCYSVPANFFLRGITPRLVSEVLNGKENV